MNKRVWLFSVQGKIDKVDSLRSRRSINRARVIQTGAREGSQSRELSCVSSLSRA